MIANTQASIAARELVDRKALVLERLDKRLPIRPRPLHRETPESYISRALRQNSLSATLNDFLIRKYREVYVDLPEKELIALIAERKGGLEPGFFERVRPSVRPHPDGGSCERCFHNFGEQFICRLCASGQIARQYSWIEQNVCLRHRLWIAPGVHTGTFFMPRKNEIEKPLSSTNTPKLSNRSNRRYLAGSMI